MLLALLRALGMESCLGSRSVAESNAPIVDTELPMPWTEPAVYCKFCQMWLNGQAQWADHIPGKKHKKNVQRKHMAAAAGEPQREPSSG